MPGRRHHCEGNGTVEISGRSPSHFRTETACSHFGLARGERGLRTGDVLAFVAIPWFVLQTTGSAVRTGLTGAAFLLAAVMAGIFGGPVVDRIGFKRTSMSRTLRER